MWSPISSFSPARPLRAYACCCLLLLCAAISGCAGYQLASSTSSVLGDGTKTLKIKGIDYPTLHPWLAQSIRSRLRDEIGARYLARWVDSGSADYEIQINVLMFTTREWIRTEVDTSQMYTTAMTIQAVVYDGSSNSEIWRSNRISYSDYEEQTDEKAASVDIIAQVIRQLADELRRTF